MKKAISTILAVIATAVALTGCNSSTTSISTSGDSSSSSNTLDESGSSESSGESGLSGSSSESSSSSSSSESGSSSSSSDSRSSSSSSDSSSSSSSSDSSSSSSTSESNSSGSSGDSGSFNTSNEFGLPLPQTRAGEMVARALAADSWGAMMMLGSDEELSILVSDELKFNMLDDGCFVFNMISGHKYVILAAKPKTGDVETVKTIFDDRYNYYKNDPNAAFYLAEQQDVAGTVSGVTDDGYYYVVVHKNGADIADAMVK